MEATAAAWRLGLPTERGTGDEAGLRAGPCPGATLPPLAAALLFSTFFFAVAPPLPILDEGIALALDRFVAPLLPPLPGTGFSPAAPTVASSPRAAEQTSWATFGAAMSATPTTVSSGAGSPFRATAPAPLGFTRRGFASAFLPGVAESFGVTLFRVPPRKAPVFEATVLVAPPPGRAVFTVGGFGGGEFCDKGTASTPQPDGAAAAAAASAGGALGVGLGCCLGCSLPLLRVPLEPLRLPALTSSFFSPSLLEITPLTPSRSRGVVFFPGPTLSASVRFFRTPRLGGLGGGFADSRGGTSALESSDVLLPSPSKSCLGTTRD